MPTTASRSQCHGGGVFRKTRSRMSADDGELHILSPHGRHAMPSRGRSESRARYTVDHTSRQICTSGLPDGAAPTAKVRPLERVADSSTYPRNRRCTPPADAALTDDCRVRRRAPSRPERRCEPQLSSHAASARRLRSSSRSGGVLLHPQQLRISGFHMASIETLTTSIRSPLAPETDLLAALSSEPTPGLEPGTPSLRVKCSTS